MLKRNLTLPVLLSGAYMQVFLGYAEVYSVELYFVSLYAAVAALWMRGKLPFYCIPLVFMVMVFSHYLTALLLPSFILLAYYEYKEKGIRNILVGCVGVALSLVILVIALHADVKRFIPPMTHSPFLSIFPASDTFEAYTMFSLYHLTDLISLGMLLVSSSIILLVISALSTRRGTPSSIEMKFLFASVVPIVLFAATAKFDLGMPNDWDTLAPYFFLINLFAIIWFLQGERPEKERTILLCLAIAAFNTLAWVGVNASESATVARTALLGDKRIVSQQGVFQHTYHLENYYAYRGDIPSIVTLWEQYIEHYPKDEVGYKRAAEYLVKSGNQTNPKTMQLMERWLSLSPNNAEARSALAKICVNTGEELLRNAKMNETRQSFVRAIGLDSLTVMAYYNMGTMYLQNGSPDSAILWYSTAIKVDSTFLRSFDALSVAYLRRGDNVSAVKILETAVGRDTTDPNIYFRLGQIYHRMGKLDNAVESMKKAARLGNPYAQDLLRNSNITW